MVNDEATSSSNHNATRRVSRVGLRMRNPSVRLGMARRRVGEALALPQGVSIAADFANLVLERKSASGQNVDVNDLALIYAYAVKESLANVYGHKLGSFATSFERSFNTTLRTLVEINDSACPDNLSKSEDVSKGDEELKADLEDITKAFMFTLIKDLFTACVFNVLAWTWYGAYVFSEKRIMEGSSVCGPFSWGVPHTEFSMLICRLRARIQVGFGGLMTILVMYLIFLRSSPTKKKMRLPFTILFLGIVCGLLGKFCVDSLGGNGKLWIFLWGTFLGLQFVANVFPLALYGLVYGPIDLIQETTKSSTTVSYWTRHVLFIGVIMLVLPMNMINGLLPFGTFGEWRGHASGVYESLGDFLGDSPFGLFFFVLICVANFIF